MKLIALVPIALLAACSHRPVAHRLDGIPVALHRVPDCRTDPDLVFELTGRECIDGNDRGYSVGGPVADQSAAATPGSIDRPGHSPEIPGPNGPNGPGVPGGKDKPDRPGHGYGDKNHDHSGPPGQNKAAWSQWVDPDDPSVTYPRAQKFTAVNEYTGPGIAPARRPKGRKLRDGTIVGGTVSALD